MLKKTLQYIVVFLGILIIFAFFALIYGMYLKISTNSENMILNPENISLNLKKEEEIVDIRIIDENRLLIIIKNSSTLKGAVYNIKQKKILEFINK
tara:strand:- start:118 stop:405 length:288 start_codon:yes stop_codon:yes gene_type:complete